MEWFILSRDMHILCAPSTLAPMSLPIYNDKQTILISNNVVVSTYDFTIPSNHKDANSLQMGNYIVFRDKYKKMRMYTLVSYDGDDISRIWHSEDVGMDLINETANKWTLKEPHPIDWYLNKYVLDDSGWTIGINEISNLTRSLSFDGQSDSKLTRLGDIANQFDGAEVDFTIEMNGSTVTKQVVNIYKKVGTDLTQQRFIDSVNLQSLQSSGSIANICTAMLGLGSSLQNEDSSDGGQITFINELYDDGRYYSPVGQPYIFDRVGRQQWSRYRGFGFDKQGEFEGYIDGLFTYDTSDPKELLKRTLTEIKKRVSPEETFQANLLDIKADVGDYVQIAHNNYNPPIYLSARVEQVENCYTADGQDIGTLGDYTRLQSQIDPRVQQMIDGLANQLKYSYTWIRYAKDDKGTGMASTPTADTKYVAIVSNKPMGVPSDDPADYAGHWQLIQGQDGKDGIPGATGADGKTSYTHFAYANDVSGHSDFSLDDPTDRSYMGVYSDFTKPDSTNPDDYVWSLTKGETGEQGLQGLQGPTGTQGIAGPKGADGKTQYTHIAYANSADGVTNFSTSDSNRTYIGMYVDFNVNDSTTPGDYSWTLVKGADGSQGTPGKPGTDGKTPYLHTAYSWSADGTDRFMTVYPNENLAALSTLSQWPGAQGNTIEITTQKVSIHSSGGMYLGLRILNINALTPDTRFYVQFDFKPTSGTVTRIGGHFTDTFSGVKNIKINGQATETGDWQNGVPYAFTNGQTYHIEFEAITKSNPKPDTGTLGIFIQPNRVKFGESYDAEITRLKFEKQSRTPYTPSPLDDPEGAYPKFIGTYTDYIADDSTDPSKYTWAKLRGEQGPKGDTGEDGVAGKDGVGIKSTQIMYAQSTSGTTAPTTGWTAQVPTLIKGQYLWTQTTWVYTDNTGEAGYTVSYNAKDGNTGANGIAGKDGVGIKSTTITYQSGTSGTVQPTGAWVSNPPSVAGGNYLWTRTIWSYTDKTSETGYSVAKMGEKGAQGLQGLQGATGNQGIQGPKGPDGKSSYTHIAYGTSNSGAGFTQTPSTSTTYIGMYVDQTATDNNDPKKYAWSLIKGADGANGTPGAKGADGKTPYFHQAWADSKDGKVNFNTTDPTNRGYLGTYSDFTQADSIDPSKYFWVELVGNLVIGGRNLYLNSRVLADGYSVNGATKVTVEPFDSTTNMWHIVSEQGKGVVVGIYFYGRVTDILPDNSYWSYSVDIKGTGVTSKIGINESTRNPVIGTVGSEWSRIIQTGWVDTPTKKTIVMYFDTTDSPLDVYIKLPKLEKGNKATDWSPAPEDTQGQIDTINNGLANVNSKIAAVTKVDSQATAPTNPKKGDQWWVKDANGEINAFKIWDGSKWVDSIIQQSLLNIVTLNSVTLNSAVINSPDINVPFTNLALPGFPEKMTGVMTVKDAKYSIDGKYGTGGSVFHTGLTPDGWESYKTATDGSTKLDYARVNFGELQLWTYLSGSGSNAKYAQGSLSGQDTYRNSTATLQYLGGWGDWGNGAGWITVTRNGRMVTLSGYPKQNGSPNFSNIVQLPEWAKPLRDVNLPAMSLDSSVHNPTAAKLVVNTNGTLSATFTQRGGYVAIGASYFGKDIS